MLIGTSPHLSRLEPCLRLSPHTAQHFQISLSFRSVVFGAEYLKAVAQKSPCERNRVIMGKESLLKHSQRGQDARQEVPMRTPKQLYAQERIIYQPELLTCPHCGDLLVSCNYLAWDKTVQMLDRVLSVASRPGRCPHVTCVGSRMRLLSAEGQRLALPGSTYGYDVVVRIGWWLQV